jgi:hypothetical protein
MQPPEVSGIPARLTSRYQTNLLFQVGERERLFHCSILDCQMDAGRQGDSSEEENMNKAPVVEVFFDYI